MRPLKQHKNADGQLFLEVPLRGSELLRHPLLNKGSAFSARERADFHLHGLLPHETNTLEQQVQRAGTAIKRLSDPMDRYASLVTLQNRNEQLFFSVLCENLQELMPVIYTPTVGQATQRFSHEFRGGRGLWITPEHKGMIKDMLRRGPFFDDIRLIVITDSESILGIGDQGAGGMAISIGKLALYTAGAGIHPAQTLPICLDVGTNNEELLNDDLYLGWRKPRITGDEYFELVAEFVDAVTEIFPRVLIQWEDFRNNNALILLEKYRDEYLSFNDDIQGTGAVTVAGVLSGLRVKDEKLAGQRIVIHGAGAAGYGIALQIMDELSQFGLSEEEITRSIAVLDSKGLVISDRLPADHYKQKLAWSRDLAKEFDLDVNDPSLEMVVDNYKPTILIGSSGSPGAFSQSIVESILTHTERPIILPFSNPTSLSEAAPADLLKWSNGKALVATGSPYDPVELNGETYVIGQGNNVFIFPGLGLGALVAESRQVTDGMVNAAASALAKAVTDEELATGSLYPSVTRLREVCRQVGIAVALRAVEEGVAAMKTEMELQIALDEMIWDPVYPEYIPV
ncbi:MAG: NAD-dependent malic enzyme [Gammaproteobacteria bacterium]|jgi:malate dehydrogenase (oxaloacetate-decarboxylating)|nr:NAD-dependent malic enzyme [Gammaproteobacteria bacterium]MBT7369387.1 NAD-dependent malic enzyme [Gammaproteobacteria bacterium]